jgi:hypothetical protein
VKLRPELYGHIPPIWADQPAADLELRVASALEAEGYVVDGGAPGFFWDDR